MNKEKHFRRVKDVVSRKEFQGKQVCSTLPDATERFHGTTAET